MLEYLKSENTGPFSTAELTFAERLNVITGGNGLGKSFLLDVIWWALTDTWPCRLNGNLNRGFAARPGKGKSATISFSLNDFFAKSACSASFDDKTRAWTGLGERVQEAGIVVYAMEDGSFAVFHGIGRLADSNPREKPQAYVFTQRDILDGPGNAPCDGLVRDLVRWQEKNREAFAAFKELMRRLSPEGREPLVPCDLAADRFGHALPTISMGYGEPVPFCLASPAMRRILSFACLLVWSIEEYKRQCRGEQSPAVTILYDYVDAHMHPAWQRSLVPSMVFALQELAGHTQYFFTTLSPIVLGSLEDIFAVGNNARDAWFDIDLIERSVRIDRCDFMKQGCFGNWLTSEAFDLPTDFSLSKEKLFEELGNRVRDPGLTRNEALELEQRMLATLSEVDPLWIRWRMFLRSKGW